MINTDITKKLIDIKRLVSELAVEYLEMQKPIPLSDVGKQLKPFIVIDSAIDQAIKKFSSGVVSGSIPKSNRLQS